MASFSKIYNNCGKAKNVLHKQEKKKTYEAIFIYRHIFYLFVCLGTISAQLSTRELHLFLEQYYFVWILQFSCSTFFEK